MTKQRYCISTRNATRHVAVMGVSNSTTGIFTTIRFARHTHFSRLPVRRHSRKNVEWADASILVCTLRTTDSLSRHRGDEAHQLSLGAPHPHVQLRRVSCQKKKSKNKKKRKKNKKTRRGYCRRHPALHTVPLKRPFMLSSGRSCWSRPGSDRTNPRVRSGGAVDDTVFIPPPNPKWNKAWRPSVPRRDPWWC